MNVLFALCAIVMQNSFATTKLIIHSPKRLMEMFPYVNADGNTETGVIPASYANFGFIPYGHSMVSIFVIIDQNFMCG
jgi:hypothetical protein